MLKGTEGQPLLIDGEVVINNSNNKYAFAFYSFFRLGSSKDITYLK